MRSDGSDPIALRAERDQAIEENAQLKVRDARALPRRAMTHVLTCTHAPSPAPQKQLERQNYRITHLVRALDAIGVQGGK